MKWKNRFTNYNFWISLISAVLLILQAFKIEFDIAYFNEIATAVLGLMVVIGIISDPTKTAMKDEKSKDKDAKCDLKDKAQENKNNLVNQEDFAVPCETQDENASNNIKNDFKVLVDKISHDLQEENQENSKTDVLSAIINLVKVFDTNEGENMDSINENVTNETATTEDINKESVNENVDNLSFENIEVNEQVKIEEIENTETLDSVNEIVLNENIAENLNDNNAISNEEILVNPEEKVDVEVLETSDNEKVDLEDLNVHEADEMSTEIDNKEDVEVEKVEISNSIENCDVETLDSIDNNHVEEENSNEENNVKEVNSNEVKTEVKENTNNFIS